MNSKLCVLLTITFLSCCHLSLFSQNLTYEQEEIIEAISAFSETTSPEGEGADDYSDFLSEEFSRWTLGSDNTFNKEEWVEAIRDWFDSGWRVVEREQEFIEILVLDELAHVRRMVTETYEGPDDESTSSTAAIIELWIYEGGEWLLFRSNVHPFSDD